MYKAG